MKKCDYILVGSSLYVGVFAWYTRKSKKRCLMVEKRNHIGGNMYYENVEGIRVHEYGAHIFHTGNQKVWEFVSSLTEFNRYTNGPVASCKGQMYNMPFNMNTSNHMWGISAPGEAKAIIEKQRAEITGGPKDLEEQAIRLVGRELYKKLVKGYTEKRWGRDCKELPAFIIKRMLVRYIYDSNCSNDPYQGIPIGGYSVIVERLFEDCDVGTSADYLENREHYNSLGETVVYAGTIGALYGCRLGKLEHRSLRFEFQMLNQEDHQGVAMVSYTDRDAPYTRVIEHKYFEFGIQPRAVITREYPVSRQGGMEPYYPVNDQKNQELCQRYEELARTGSHVLLSGRLGEYKYYDMGKVIESAMSRAEEIFR